MAASTAPVSERRLLDVDSGRNYLGGISREAFYRFVRTGELAVVKLGRRTFVDRNELDRFIDARPGAA
jgi:hypothetical protein